MMLLPTGTSVRIHIAVGVTDMRNYAANMIMRIWRSRSMD
jgi:hypothetical protein